MVVMHGPRRGAPFDVVKATNVTLFSMFGDQPLPSFDRLMYVARSLYPSTHSLGRCGSERSGGQFRATLVRSLRADDGIDWGSLRRSLAIHHITGKPPHNLGNHHVIEVKSSGETYGGRDAPRLVAHASSRGGHGARCRQAGTSGHSC